VKLVVSVVVAATAEAAKKRVRDLATPPPRSKKSRVQQTLPIVSYFGPFVEEIDEMSRMSRTPASEEIERPEPPGWSAFAAVEGFVGAAATAQRLNPLSSTFGLASGLVAVNVRETRQRIRPSEGELRRACGGEMAQRRPAQKMHSENVDARLFRLECQVSRLATLVEERILPECTRMGDHISFVEDVYSRVRRPLEALQRSSRGTTDRKQITGIGPGVEDVD